MKVKDPNSTLWKYSKLVLLIADEFGIDAATAKNIITDIALDEHDTLTDYLKTVDFGESEDDSWDEEYDGSGCDVCDDEYDEDADENEDESEADDEDGDDYYDDENTEDEDEDEEYCDDECDVDYPDDIETTVDSRGKIRIPAAFMKAVFNNESDDIWDECGAFYHTAENKITIGKRETFDYLFTKKNPGKLHIYSNRGAYAEWGFNMRLLKSVDSNFEWFTLHFNPCNHTIEITW